MVRGVGALIASHPVGAAWGHFPFPLPAGALQNPWAFWFLPKKISKIFLLGLKKKKEKKNHLLNYFFTS